MDKDEYLKKNVGIPTDPARQKDPEEHGAHVPAEGRSDFLNDVTEQHGGQRTEVGLPWEGGGDLQRGVRDRIQRDDEAREEDEPRRAGPEDLPPEDVRR